MVAEIVAAVTGRSINGGRRTVNGGEDAGNDIVDKGKIPSHVAVVSAGEREQPSQSRHERLRHWRRRTGRRRLTIALLRKAFEAGGAIGVVGFRSAVIGRIGPQGLSSQIGRQGGRP